MSFTTSSVFFHCVDTSSTFFIISFGRSHAVYAGLFGRGFSTYILPSDFVPSIAHIHSKSPPI
jgi:hypothetical protein